MIKLTAHAVQRMREYGIERAWVEATILTAGWTAADPRQPAVTRSFKVIPERGGRVLRVAHRPEGADVPSGPAARPLQGRIAEEAMVLSAHFDRGAKA